MKISYVVEILLGDSEKLGLDSLEGKGGSGEGSSESSWTCIHNTQRVMVYRKRTGIYLITLPVESFVHLRTILIDI